MSKSFSLSFFKLGIGLSPVISSVPIFYLSTSKNIPLEKIYQLGFDDYFTKPFIPCQILRRLESRVWFLKFFEASSHSPLKDIIWSTCRFLMSDMGYNGHLDDLAKEMGTNRSTLNSLFKLRFGMATMTWFRSYKMHRAAKYLTDTFLTISEVSWQVGYEDSNNFSTAFKHTYGISPSKYRQQLQKSKE